MQLQQFSINKIYVTMYEQLSELHCNVSLFSNHGEKVRKTRKTRGQICPIIFYFSWPSPRDWRTTIHCNAVLTIFHTWWHIFCVWIFVGTAFWWIVVFQSRGDCPRTFTNFIVPGSESASYILLLTVKLSGWHPIFIFSYSALYCTVLTYTLCHLYFKSVNITANNIGQYCSCPTTPVN